MAFKIGRFLGRIGSGLIKSAPSALAGYATMGPAGAGLALLGGTSFGGARNPTPAGSSGMYNMASNFADGATAYPVADTPGNYPTPAVPNPGGSSMVSKIPRAVFDAIVILGGRLGIKMRDPARFASIGRKIMGKLIRFARLNPGLSIVSMLINFGLSVDLANQLINWYATSGKKRRRLRVTNVKALNRSVRRLEGFHKLSVRVNAALAGRSSARSMPRRRCTKCRKNPCGC